MRPRRTSAISRALSSGALERGQFAKLRDDELPELLEVVSRLILVVKRYLLNVLIMIRASKLVQPKGLLIPPK